MKKILSILFGLCLVAVSVYAVDSSTVLNTTNGRVFNIAYESGVATVTVAGVVSATTVSATVLTANYTNASIGGTFTALGTGTAGNLTTTGTATIAAATVTGAAAVSTNLAVAAALPITVNGTNYHVKLYLTTGP